VPELRSRLARPGSGALATASDPSTRSPRPPPKVKLPSGAHPGAQAPKPACTSRSGSSEGAAERSADEESDDRPHRHVRDGVGNRAEHDSTLADAPAAEEPRRRPGWDWPRPRRARTSGSSPAESTRRDAASADSCASSPAFFSIRLPLPANQAAAEGTQGQRPTGLASAVGEPDRRAGYALVPLELPFELPGAAPRGAGMPDSTLTISTACSRTP
jgi:hypothetical protein